MDHVFISYSSVDYVFAERLCTALEQRGFPTWFDKSDIRSGTQWDVSISRAIEISRALVFVLSPDSLSEDCWARKELHVASDVGVPIIPVLHRRCKWRRELLLTNLQCLDHLTLWIGKGNGPKRENPLIHFDKLMEALCHEISVAKKSEEARSPEDTPDLAAKQFYSAAEHCIDLGLFGNALNRLRLAEKLNPEDSDLLGQILYLKEQVTLAILRDKDRSRQNNASDFREDLTQFGEEGNTNIQGIVRLAILQERQGYHEQAVRNLRRACMMEPRIKYKAWAKQYLSLSDAENYVLDRIIVDLS